MEFCRLDDCLSTIQGLATNHKGSRSFEASAEHIEDFFLVISDENFRSHDMQYLYEMGCHRPLGAFSVGYATNLRFAVTYSPNCTHKVIRRVLRGGNFC